ncbi:hypothetical protein [Streptomyces huasconensis]
MDKATTKATRQAEPPVGGERELTYDGLRTAQAKGRTVADERDAQPQND